MKKFLITGGVLFSVLPAMALDLTTLYTTTAPTNTGSCSGDDFQSNSVSMQAVYVTETCPAGYYFDVPANAAIDSTTGIVTGTSCQPCTDGYYCPSTVTVAANNGVLSTQGRTQCPAGAYGNATNRGTIPSDTNDPDYNTILANYTACQACSGTTYASNTGSTSCTTVTQGWYADKVNSNDPGNTTQTQCPFGYRTVAAASLGDCEKVINCPNECSNLKNTSSCSIDDTMDGHTVTFGNRTVEGSCFETIARNAETGEIECAPGYEKQNMYAWMADHMDSVSSNVTYCSPDGKTNGVASFEDCENMEPGTTTYNFITGYNTPTNSVHNVTVCSDYLPATFNANDINTYIISATEAQANGFNGQSTGRYCWTHNIDIPDQPWFLAKEYTNVSRCAENCGGFVLPQSGSDYMYGSMQDGNFVLSQNGTLAALSYGAMASMTDGQNGHPTADVCVANTITINWGDIADPGDAGTCTYGEDFTAPQSGPNPADHPGLKFLGWKVIPTNNNNNN